MIRLCRCRSWVSPVFLAQKKIRTCDRCSGNDIYSWRHCLWRKIDRQVQNRTSTFVDIVKKKHHHSNKLISRVIFSKSLRLLSYILYKYSSWIPQETAKQIVLSEVIDFNYKLNKYVFILFLDSFSFLKMVQVSFNSSVQTLSIKFNCYLLIQSTIEFIALWT